MTNAIIMKEKISDSSVFIKNFFIKVCIIVKNCIKNNKCINAIQKYSFY
jgi:hypothetical protein